MLSRNQVFIPACILLVTALAWAYLLHLDSRMAAAVDYEKAMAAMGMSVNQPWTRTDALLTFLMWTVMMAAMMAPAATPVLLLFAKTRGANTLLFGLGYFVVWTGFSAAATGVQWILHEAALLSAAMAASGPRLGGGIFIAAGLYQFTSWKGECLTHCRTPLGFLMANWRDGKLGALQMGLRHGMYCLGCCWALMGVLFAVGVMNLLWVAGLAVFVLLEKIGPQGPIFARVAGAVLVILGFLRLV